MSVKEQEKKDKRTQVMNDFLGRLTTLIEEEEEIQEDKAVSEFTEYTEVLEEPRESKLRNLITKHQDGIHLMREEDLKTAQKEIVKVFLRM